MPSDKFEGPTGSPRSSLRVLSQLAWIGVGILLTYVGVKNWNAPRPFESKRLLPSSTEMLSASQRPSLPPSAPTAPSTQARSRVRAVWPAPVVEERVEYYEVSGSSASELRDAVNRLAPRGTSEDEGGWSEATTRWDVDWHWESEYSSVDAECALVSFRTLVRIHTIMPKWPGRVDGSRLAEAWERYVRALAEHERGHAENGVRAATAIGQRIADGVPAPSCEMLATWIREEAEMVIAQYQKEDIEYDRRTRHGVEQGIVFPADKP